jgi:peptidoglycan/LPS O-acetylase OafA/YrhL
MSSPQSQNSLDLLRLLAAWMVLFSHQFALLGLPEPSFLGLNTFGGAGVAVFFFLSGSLVWSSWRRDPHWGRYLARRALRIFPALWLVVLLSVLVLGPLLTTWALPDYFSARETGRYWLNALLSIKYNLPGVFEGNFLKAVNGSLWTLPAEFLSYLLVAIWGWARWRGWSWRVALGVLLMVALSTWFWGKHGVFKPELEVMALFWWGVVYGEYRWATQQKERWPWLVWAILFVALLLFAGTTDRGLERAGLMLLAAGSVHVAMQVSWGGVLLRRLGDVSYGVYIYAFPVQQTLVYLLPHASFMVHLCLSTLITMGLAYASWHGIEKVALRWKPKGVVSS